MRERGLIDLYAKELRLPTLSHYQEVIRLAKEQGLDYEGFLIELLTREVTNRKQNQLKRRVKQARFPLVKSLDTFQFEYFPHVAEALVWELATGDFIAKKENIVMVGPPGTGKTHLALALGYKAAEQGYSVRFFTASGLANQLAETLEQRGLTKLEEKLAKCHLLILDELSYVSFSRHQTELLFQVLSERTERSSTIITTNLDFSRWGEIFADTMMATALVDRLTYRSHVLNMNAESYRFKKSKRNQAK
jgi:DNA replication protein DnaC